MVALEEECTLCPRRAFGVRSAQPPANMSLMTERMVDHYYLDDRLFCRRETATDESMVELATDRAKELRAATAKLLVEVGHRQREVLFPRRAAHSSTRRVRRHLCFSVSSRSTI